MHCIMVRAPSLAPGPVITATALNRAPGALPAVVDDAPARALLVEVRGGLSRVCVEVVVVEVVARLKSGARSAIVLLLRMIMLM